MGLRMRVEGDRIFGRATLGHYHEGAPGYAHGGAVATLLDDALGTLLVMLKTPAVTANLTIDYRRPALIGRELVVEAWVDRIDGRKHHFLGELRDDGEVVAEARGLFLQVDVEHFRRGHEHSEQVAAQVAGEPARPSVPW